MFSKSIMAGDLTDAAYLAHQFELNASKFRSVYDEIYRKYDHDFPDDDIIELRSARIIHDRGIVKSMPTKRVGCVEKHGHVKADANTYPSHSQLDQGNITSSPEAEKSFLSMSEKSFISVNCSRWVNNIEEESEPSDAETLTDSEEDSDSWEDETEEAVTLLGSEEADSRGEEADWSIPEHRSHEEEEWLTVTQTEHRKRQNKHLSKRNTKHAYPHTSPHSISHKTHKQNDVAKYRQHNVYQYVPRHSGRKGELPRVAPQSGVTAEPNVTDRFGLPRRVRLVPVVTPLQGSKETSDIFSKEPRCFFDLDTYTDEKSALKKVFSHGERDPLQTRSESAGLPPSSAPLFASGCDDVDFFLPSGSLTDAIHADDMSVEDGLLPLQDNTTSYRRTEPALYQMCPTESLSVHPPPVSRVTLENTFTISKSTPVSKMMPKNIRMHIPNETDVRTSSVEEDELTDVHPNLKMGKQEVDAKQDCKKPAAEIPCLAVAAEKILPGTNTPTDSYGVQSERTGGNVVTCWSSALSSCDSTMTKSMGMPHDSHRRETPLPKSGTGDTNAAQDINLKQRGISLIEIKKKLDRLSALFSSSSNLTPKMLDTHDKSIHSKEDEVVEPDVALMYAVPPEKMEISPEPELKKKPDDLWVVSSPEVTTRSEGCCPFEMKDENVSPMADIPTNKTFIVTDGAECKHTASSKQPFSPRSLAPVIDSTSGTTIYQGQSGHKEQESKPKRRFCPVYKPFSSDEIQDVLEMFDSESVINFLKEKSFQNERKLKDQKCHMTLSAVSQKDSWKEFHPEPPHHSSETEPLDTQAQCTSHQLPCKQEKSICVECWQLPQENRQNGATDVPGQFSPVELCMPKQGMWEKCPTCHNTKICGKLPKVAESRQQNDQSQTAHWLLPGPSHQYTDFLATPGQIFRQTIRSLHLPSRTPGADLSVQDDVKGEENQSSQEECRENVDMQPSCKTDLSSVLKRQTAKSAALFAELESESVFPATSVSSAGTGEKQTQLYGSPVHTQFLQMKQSTDRGTSYKSLCRLSSSGDECKACCHKTCSCVHQHTTASTPVCKTDCFSRADSATTPDKCSQERASFVNASGDGPLSLLNEMDHVKTVLSEKRWPKTSSTNTEQSQRESRQSKATTETGSCPADDTQHKEKSSASLLTAQQTLKERRDKRVLGLADAGSPSPLCRCSICSLASMPQTTAEHPPGTTLLKCYSKDSRTLDQRDQYRMQKTGDKSNESMHSVTCDSLSVTPQNQFLDPNQSSTPSKLLDRLQLSDQRSPLNLTKNCNKLSQLLLDSPGERKGECTSPGQLKHDGQPQLGEDLDFGQQRDSPHTTAAPMSQHENCSWKIFKSRNSRSGPQMASRHSSSHTNRCSSPQNLAETACTPKLQGRSERRMIRISSPQAGKMGSASHPFSFSSNPSVPTGSPRLPLTFGSDSAISVGSCKRSFQSDLDGVNYASHKDKNSTNSPLKRRRLNAIHGTSTPSKTDRGGVRFDMDESLSTIAGENSDLNSTLDSSDLGAPDHPTSGSEEEDEVTLIPE